MEYAIWTFTWAIDITTGPIAWNYKLQLQHKAKIFSETINVSISEALLFSLGFFLTSRFISKEEVFWSRYSKIIKSFFIKCDGRLKLIWFSFCSLCPAISTTTPLLWRGYLRTNSRVSCYVAPSTMWVNRRDPAYFLSWLGERLLLPLAKHLMTWTRMPWKLFVRKVSNVTVSLWFVNTRTAE